MKTCYLANSNDINEELLVSKVLDFKPNLIVLSICYSNVSKVKIILERRGVLAERRLERNLIYATNGNAIELDDKQVELFYEVAKPNFINKNVVIQGPEGSGKTLLGIEIVRLIAHNYIYTQHLSPMQSKKDLRVILSACFNEKHPRQVDLWKKQVESIVNHAHSLYEVEVHTIRARTAQHPQAYNDHNNLILELLKKDTKYGEYKKTIIMIDELNPCFESETWSMYRDLKCRGINNVQIVFNLKYDFHDLKFRMESNANDARSYEDFDTIRFDNVLVGRLHKAHRCSNEIRNFVHFLLMHAFDDGYKFKYFDHDESTFSSKRPVWIDIKDSKSFIASLNHNKGNRESLFEHCLGDGGTQSKTVLIYDPDTIDSEVKSICDSKRWECVSKTEAVGTEFSRVIIYGLKEFHFEAFTRAVNQLIIVTTSPYVSVF